MRYLISISYDGSKFKGFQRQKGVLSVQKTIEDALSKIAGSPIAIKGAGRTDANVHALDQKAHFDLDLSLDVNRLKLALNKMVAPYILINDCKIVNDDFHCRFEVIKKTYVYKIHLGVYNPFLYDYVLFAKNLDINLMQKAANLFLGVHDFENFVSGERKSYQAIIYAINFNQTGDILEIEFVGKSFYRYMVRSLVGALIDVGQKKVALKELEDSLLKKSSKRFSVALANGLYLKNIKYNEF